MVLNYCVLSTSRTRDFAKEERHDRSHRIGSRSGVQAPWSSVALATSCRRDRAAGDRHTPDCAPRVQRAQRRLQTIRHPVGWGPGRQDLDRGTLLGAAPQRHRHGSDGTGSGGAAGQHAAADHVPQGRRLTRGETSCANRRQTEAPRPKIT